MYDNIFKAHIQTKQPLILHGQSGYGKTKVIEKYARDNGMRLVVIRGIYLDPLNMFIPHKTGAQRVGLEVVESGNVSHFEDVPALWIFNLLNTKEPTIVFFDEMGRVPSVIVFNMMMEPLNERTIHGRPISDHVTFIGATNFLDEDSGLTSFPDALWRRATHLVHAPDSTTIVQNIGSEFMQGVLTEFPDVIPTPKANVDFPLTTCSRQVSAIDQLRQTGILTDLELKKCIIGKIGESDGIRLYNRIKQYEDKIVVKIPPVLTDASQFPALFDYEVGGNVGELCQYLLVQKNQELVAKYLIFLAGPELCKMMQASTVGGNPWDYLLPVPANEKETGPYLGTKSFRETFFHDTPGENNFEGTEYGEFFKVNKYNYLQFHEVQFDTDTVSTILLLKIAQKINDYSILEAPEELRRQKMTCYSDVNQLKEQYLKKEAEGGIFFYEELRKQLAKDIRDRVAAEFPVGSVETKVSKPRAKKKA